MAIYNSINYLGAQGPFFGGPNLNQPQNVGLSDKHLKPAIQKFQFNLALGDGVTNDQAYLMFIPAFTQVDSIQAYNVTALSVGSGPAFSLGDTGSATRYVNAFATTSINAVWTQALTTNPLYFYAANDKLLLRVTGGTLPGTGTIQFVVTMTDSTADAPMTVQ